MKKISIIALVCLIICIFCGCGQKTAKVNEIITKANTTESAIEVLPDIYDALAGVQTSSLNPDVWHIGMANDNYHTTSTGSSPDEERHNFTAIIDGGEVTGISLFIESVSDLNAVIQKAIDTYGEPESRHDSLIFWEDIFLTAFEDSGAVEISIRNSKNE